MLFSSITSNVLQVILESGVTEIRNEGKPFSKWDSANQVTTDWLTNWLYIGFMQTQGLPLTTEGLFIDSPLAAILICVWLPPSMSAANKVFRVSTSNGGVIALEQLMSHIERRPTTTETQVAYDNSTWYAINTRYPWMSLW